MVKYCLLAIYESGVGKKRGMGRMGLIGRMGLMGGMGGMGVMGVWYLRGDLGWEEAGWAAEIL